MSKIHSEKLISLFNQMYSEHWSYEWGAAREGCVDCSGAFVYAYKTLGGPALLHSSNAIPRNNCGALQKNTTNKAPAGWVALKWRQQTDEKLIKKYGNDDYYHIGLVDDSGEYVLNAKGTAYGFSRDKLNSKWQYITPLSDVIYDKVESVLEAKYVARVSTESSPLRVRTTPEDNGAQIGKIPKGTLVDVYDDSDAKWWKIGYDGLVGYASAAYLTKVGAVDDEPATPTTPSSPSTDDDSVSITLSKDVAYELFELLHNALGDD